MLINLEKDNLQDKLYDKWIYQHQYVSACRGDTKRIKYANIINAFDIETTSLREIKQNFMYHWQVQLGLDYTIIGRTWEQYRQFINYIASDNPKAAKIVFYVHNLSYEFQYLSSIFDFDKKDVFCLRQRKIAMCRWKNIEWRCSYLLTNMSLEKLTAKYAVPHAKTKDLDYSIVRYPSTELSQKELQYCINDVLGLVEALTKDFEVNKVNVANVPMTSTGYLRRIVKRDLSRIRKEISLLQPDVFLYQLLREEFRGGNTHANRFYTGEILENVGSIDISSSYPYVIHDCKYPLKPFVRYRGDNWEKELNGKPWLARVTFANVELKNFMDGFPYIPYAKCRHIKNMCTDNGRILRARQLEITVNDIDWGIIRKQYKFDILSVTDVVFSEYQYLPPDYTFLVEDMYIEKTSLKGLKDLKYYYDKYKNLINSLFGLMAQNPGQDNYVYDFNEEGIKTVICENKALENVLEDYISKRGLLPYQWGCWVTAHARKRLQDKLEEIGDNAVYCDTDSVKYLGDYIEEADKEGYFYAKDSAGKKHYLGIWEDEGRYKRFITFGAKKYAYEDTEGLHITISGVNKEKGAKELEERGGLDALQVGFTWHKAAGSCMWYNDVSYDDKILDPNTGLEIEKTKNIYAEDTTYKLTINGEYLQAMLEAKDYRRLNYG